ncbi:MAG: DUF1329 domain-containing protein [Alphaproteobacteria bacterium HGW-Alphaproteobacteria-11]|nr:MAG: DUF1329 domain-containing protein [Alphaproteobacteria bacterium HGW-Alphaproteobacteria-11]
MKRNAASRLVLTLTFSAMLAGAATADPARLGADLTPMGAERAGNAAGTIPEWTGGISTPPAGYVAGQKHVDPFAGDAAIYTVDASNMDAHAANLTEGQKAMMRTHATYKLNVYPTRRSCAYPQTVYDAMKHNAANARPVDDGNGVEGARVASPFPVPTDAKQVIWNHILGYRGYKSTMQVAAATPTAGGSYTLVQSSDRRINGYADPALGDIVDLNNVESKWIRINTAPAQQAGSAFLFHNTINQKQQERFGWLYSPQNRRVVAASRSACDSPIPGTDNLRFSDMQFMYNGALDLYDWTLEGKREILTPYNTYKLSSGDFNYSELLQGGHLNPEAVRYELHRVWVVDGRLKAGARHAFHRRTLYVDEDSWMIVQTDLYGADGAVARAQEAYVQNYYEVPFCAMDSEIAYDFATGRYHVQQLKAQEPAPDYHADALKDDEFTPAALRRLVVR